MYGAALYMGAGSAQIMGQHVLPRLYRCGCLFRTRAPMAKIMCVLSILRNVPPLCNFLDRHAWILGADSNANAIAMSSLMYRYAMLYK